MNEVENLLIEERQIINLDIIIDFFRRRKKIIYIASSALFSVLFLNTIYNYTKNPIYSGSFSILIADPVDNKSANNSIQERLALNEYTYRLPTLIEYLKSELVLTPVAKEVGMSPRSLRNRINISLVGETPFVSKDILKVIINGKNKTKNMILMRKLSQRYLEAASEQRQLKLTTGLDFLNAEFPLMENKTLLIKKKIENFRKENNILEPFASAQNLENQKVSLNIKLQKYKSNLKRLELIKDEVNLNQFKIDGFIEVLSELGLNIISSDQELFNKYISLQGLLAEARTKYTQTSKVIINLQKRLETLYPEIQNKQLATIELAIKSNNTKIELAKKELQEINTKFKLQPNLLSEFEKLTRDLKIAESNFESLISAKEKFRLELAQKALPWRIIESPNINPLPISPRVQEDSIKNAILALFFGLTLASLREFFDKVFHNENQIEKLIKAFNIPLLGSVPFISSLKENNSFKEPNKDANNFLLSESFRSLATSIRFFNVGDNKTKTILITSTKQSEGKTTITSFLAKTFADLGKKVLLVDADMRRPAVHNFFEKDNIVGLSNLITDPEIKFNEILYKNIVPNLDLLTAGIRPPDPIYLISSDNMKILLNQFKDNNNYDIIFIDTPPSQGLADSKLLAEYSDLILYVVAVEDTNKNIFKNSLTSYISNVNRANGDLDVPISVIANRSKEVKYNNNGYGYNYYYDSNLYKYYNTDVKESSENNSVQEEISTESKYIRFRNNLNRSWKNFIKWIDF